MPGLTFNERKDKRRYPPFVERRRLVAQIEIAHATPGSRPPLERNDEQTLEERLGHVHAEAKRSGDGTPEETIEKHVQSILSFWRDAAKTANRSKPEINAIVSEGHTNLEKSIRFIACEECATACASQPCHANHDDESRNMDHPNGRRCWKKIDDIVEFALERGQETYNFAGRVLPSNLPIEVSVSVRHTDPKTDVNGAVSLDNDSQERRRADVMLTMPLDLSPRDYHSLLYAAFHEVFVHVPQGVLHEGKRSSVGEYCSFTEGFVDAAAAAHLQDLLGKGAGPRDWRPDLRYASRQQTKTNHNLRTTPSSKTENPHDEKVRKTKEFRLFGRAVFDDLQLFYSHDNLLTKLASSLNAGLPTNNIVRMNVLRAVEEILRDPGGTLVDLLPLLKQVGRGERPVDELLNKLFGTTIDPFSPSGHRTSSS